MVSNVSGAISTAPVLLAGANTCTGRAWRPIQFARPKEAVQFERLHGSRADARVFAIPTPPHIERRTLPRQRPSASQRSQKWPSTRNPPSQI
jgi:hypothetical protein